MKLQIEATAVFPAAVVPIVTPTVQVVVPVEIVHQVVPVLPVETVVQVIRTSFVRVPFRVMMETIIVLKSIVMEMFIQNPVKVLI